MCKFKDVICRACGKKGHLALVCNSSGRTSHRGSDLPDQRPPKPINTIPDQPPRPPNVHTVQSSNSPLPLDVEPQITSSNTEEYTLHSLPDHKSPPLEVTVTVSNSDLLIEVDTGAALSIISEQTHHTQFPTLVPESTDVHLTTYSGEAIEVLGSITASVQYQSQSAILPLVVVRAMVPHSLAGIGSQPFI